MNKTGATGLLSRTLSSTVGSAGTPASDQYEQKFLVPERKAESLAGESCVWLMAQENYWKKQLFPVSLQHEGFVEIWGEISSSIYGNLHGILYRFKSVIQNNLSSLKSHLGVWRYVCLVLLLLLENLLSPSTSASCHIQVCRHLCWAEKLVFSILPKTLLSDQSFL